MPGQATINITRKSRVYFVGCDLHPADEAALMANAGQFPAQYVTQSKIYANSRSIDAQGQEQIVQITTQEHEDQSPEVRAAIHAAVHEFYTMAAGHALIGAIFKGEFPDDEGIQGGDNWRTVNSGLPYNMHDGSGEFVVGAE